MELNEPIKVLAAFTPKPKPLRFKWSGREYTITKITLTWEAYEGRDHLYYFGVTDGANAFELCFSTENLTWSLVRVHGER